jgi:hypothetical protein
VADKAGQKETHFDSGKDEADGTKNDLSWCDINDVLRKVRGFDGQVQRDSAVPPLRSLRICIHGRKWGEQRENGVARRLYGGVQALIEICDRPVVTRLVQIEPFVKRIITLLARFPLPPNIIALDGHIPV